MKDTNIVIWKGQNKFHEFIELVKALQFKYIIKCFDKEDNREINLGAACTTKKELKEALQSFKTQGYSCHHGDLTKMKIK